MAEQAKYRRVLLKISGEGLCRPGEKGIDGQALESVAGQICSARSLGVEVAVVIGGGNIIRGARLAEAGKVPQATADYMGMLATVINGLALKEVLESLGQPARLLSAINLTAVAEPYIRGRAMRHLEKGRVVIFAAGTGNPFFTTDTAAALRATEIGAEVLLKATKVDGVYDKDPMEHEDARRFERLSLAEAMQRHLKVMDRTALSLCLERKIPVIVFNLAHPQNITAVLKGRPTGTLVEP